MKQGSGHSLTWSSRAHRLSALPVHGFLPMLPSWHPSYLSSSTIPFPWVYKVLFVRCKEIKMCVHEINVLIIIKFIVTRDVNSFFFQVRETNQFNFFLLEQVSIFAAHRVRVSWVELWPSQQICWIILHGLWFGEGSLQNTHRVN